MEFGLWFEGEMVNPDSDLISSSPRVGIERWRPSATGRQKPVGA
jgi:alpha-galactosidase